MNDRARGALLGLAVGDALGTTYEFERLEQPPYPTLATRPAVDVVGAGPFGLTPGQITDDTQLAVCLGRSLAERGTFDAADVARRYVAWMAEAFDIGNQTRGALSRIESSGEHATAGVATWRASGHRAAGNGSLMRTAPLAVAYARQPVDVLVDAAMAESALTHADPRCLLACAAFDAAIAHAIRRGGGEAGGVTDPGLEMLAAARTALETAAASLARQWEGAPDAERELISDGRVALASDLDAAQAEQPGVYELNFHLHGTAGFVRIAFRLAFWHLVHTRSWRDALVDVASRGGDADTNGAIAGALLGARDGEAAIPEAWRLRVLGATQPGSPAWADAHHPRHLLALAE
jgi:ADP-ribosylglycohydrolase